MLIELNSNWHFQFEVHTQLERENGMEGGWNDAYRIGYLKNLSCSCVCLELNNPFCGIFNHVALMFNSLFEEDPSKCWQGCVRMSVLQQEFEIRFEIDGEEIGVDWIGQFATQPVT